MLRRKLEGLCSESVRKDYAVENPLWQIYPVGPQTAAAAVTYQTGVRVCVCVHNKTEGSSIQCSRHMINNGML